MTSAPPGRSTRRISASRWSVSITCSMTSAAITASKAPSAPGAGAPGPRRATEPPHRRGDAARPRRLHERALGPGALHAPAARREQRGQLAAGAPDVEQAARRLRVEQAQEFLDARLAEVHAML